MEGTLELAFYYLTVDRPQQALEKLSSGANGLLDDSQYWLYRAVALNKLEHQDEALTAAREGLKLEPGNLNLLDILSTIQLARGDIEAAERAAKRALELAPDDPSFLGCYAVVMVHTGEFERAEELICKGAALEPDNVQIVYARSLLEHIRGNHVTLAELSREQLAQDPDDTTARRFLAAALVNKGDYTEAERHVSDLIRAEPGDEDLTRFARDLRYQVKHHETELNLYEIASRADLELREAQQQKQLNVTNAKRLSAAGTAALLGIGLLTSGFIRAGLYFIAAAPLVYLAITFIHKYFKD